MKTKGNKHVRGVFQEAVRALTYLEAELTAERGARRKTRARGMETNTAYFRGGTTGPGSSGGAPDGRGQCHHPLDEFMMSYEAFCVGAWYLFRDEAVDGGSVCLTAI